MRSFFVRTIVTACMTCLALVSFSGRARAVADRVFAFTGAITGINDPEGLLTGYIDSIDSVSGYYRFNADDMGVDFGSHAKLYESSGAAYGINLTAGTTTFTPFFSPVLRTIIRDDVPALGDVFSAFTDYTISPIPANYEFDGTGYEYTSIGLILIDPTGTALGSTQLSPVPPDLSLFRTATGYLNFINPDFASPPATVTFRIDTFVAVPEPGTFGLLLAGGVALAISRRRKV